MLGVIPFPGRAPFHGVVEVAMRGRFILGVMFGVLLAFPLFAQDQQPQSLGDIARQNRRDKEERAKSGAPPAKVFNDENMPSGGASKVDLAQLASSTAAPSERIAAARRSMARGEQFLNMLDPMDRTTLASLALQGQNSDFPGRRAWEEKLFAAKQQYVAHGRELFRQTNDLLSYVESLTAGGKVTPSDPRVTDIMHRALELVQDANKTDADFQAILLEGQGLAKKAASR